MAAGIIRRRSLAALSFSLVAGAAHAQGSGEKVVVSSKIDTEGALLGNLILVALERAASRPRHGSRSAPRASCARRCLPARSTSTPNIPATARSSSSARTIRPGATAAAPMNSSHGWTGKPTTWSGCRARRPTTPGPSRCAAMWRSARLATMEDFAPRRRRRANSPRGLGGVRRKPRGLASFESTYGFTFPRDRSWCCRAATPR